MSKKDKAGGANKSVTRRTPNVINTPPLLYGLRLAQAVPKFAKTKHSFEIFVTDLTTSSVATACKADKIDPLYQKGSKGFQMVEFAGKADLKANALLAGKTAPYQNKFFALPSKKQSQSYVLDLFNTHADRTKKLQINALLRKLVLLTISHSGTYAVTDTGDFGISALKKRSDLFPTEQMPLKCHIYLKFKDAGGKTQIADVLTLAGAPGKGAPSKPPDAKAEFDKLKAMGKKRPKSSSANELEPGINRIVALFERNKDSTVVLRAVYLDGDRMVIG